MTKDKEKPEAAKPAADTSVSGQVTGVRASAQSFQFDMEDKKGRTHTLSLEPAAAMLAAMVSTAFGSGRKLHVITKAANGASTTAVAELRFGNKPKAEKLKKAKPAKPQAVKTPAEAAAAPAAPKPTAS